MFSGLSDDLSAFGSKLSGIWSEAWASIQASWNFGELFNFEWKDLLPDWDWKSIIPEMPDWKSWFGGKDVKKIRNEFDLNKAYTTPNVPSELSANPTPKALDAPVKAIQKQTAALKQLDKAKAKVTEHKTPDLKPPATPPAMPTKALDETQAKANGVMEAVNKIPPAATQAASGATATLAALDGTTHGVRFMETFAQGILAGMSSVTGAVNKVVGAARAYLPHSPAKVGPLSDLDKVKFSETLAMNIKPAPAVNAVKAVAAGMLAAIPTTMSAPAFASPQFAQVQPPQASANQASNSGQNNSSSNAITVNLTINMTGNEASQGIDFKKHGYELAKIVQEQINKQTRLKH